MHKNVCVRLHHYLENSFETLYLTWLKPMYDPESSQ